MKIIRLLIVVLMLFSANSYSMGGFYSTVGASTDGGYVNTGVLISYFDGGIEYKKNNGEDASILYLGFQTVLCRTATVKALCFVNVGLGSESNMLKLGSRFFINDKFIELSYEDYVDNENISSFNIGIGFGF